MSAVNKEKLLEKASTILFTGYGISAFDDPISFSKRKDPVFILPLQAPQ